MELRHLRCFIGVGEEQHFGRAAERLHIAQPALSRQIQGLEREVGFLLFERLPRGVRLSDAGKAFLSDARRILQGRRRRAASRRADCSWPGRSMPFIRFQRWVNPAFYDQMMHACACGGLSTPRIVQEASDRDTHWVSSNARSGSPGSLNPPVGIAHEASSCCPSLICTFDCRST